MVVGSSYWGGSGGCLAWLTSASYSGHWGWAESGPGLLQSQATGGARGRSLIPHIVHTGATICCRTWPSSTPSLQRCAPAFLIGWMVASTAQYASPQPPTSLCQDLQVSLNAEQIQSAVAWMLHAGEQHPPSRACSLHATAKIVGMGGQPTSAHASASPPALPVSCSRTEASMVNTGDECIPGLSRPASAPALQASL